MHTLAFLCVLALLGLVACGQGGGDGGKPAGKAASADHVLVDHILIGVRGPGLPSAKRTDAEAKVFAQQLLEKLRGGADWAAAKSEHSEDPPPGGPYGMSNRGVRPDRGEYPRDQMAPAFGDVSFSLSVGEIGLASFDPRTSPFGYHIIRRVK